MQKILKNNEIVEDNWLVVAKDAESLPEGNILLPLSYWLENQASLQPFRGTVGIWIESDEEIEDLETIPPEVPVVAINFPKFVDGRGFSTARLIRERYQYQGELRAIGHFIRDQLFYLKRCGVNAFQFDDEMNLDAAKQSLNDFSDAYQAGVDQPLPLFRRR